MFTIYLLCIQSLGEASLTTLMCEYIAYVNILIHYCMYVCMYVWCLYKSMYVTYIYMIYVFMISRWGFSDYSDVVSFTPEAKIAHLQSFIKEIVQEVCFRYMVMIFCLFLLFGCLIFWLFCLIFCNILYFSLLNNS